MTYAFTLVRNETCGVESLECVGEGTRAFIWPTFCEVSIIIELKYSREHFPPTIRTILCRCGNSTKCKEFVQTSLLMF